MTLIYILSIVKINKRRIRIYGVIKKRPINSLNKLGKERTIGRKERLDYHQQVIAKVIHWKRVLKYLLRRRVNQRMIVWKMIIMLKYNFHRSLKRLLNQRDPRERVDCH